MVAILATFRKPNLEGLRISVSSFDPSLSETPKLHHNKELPSRNCVKSAKYEKRGEGGWGWPRGFYRPGPISFSEFKVTPDLGGCLPCPPGKNSYARYFKGKHGKLYIVGKLNNFGKKMNCRFLQFCKRKSQTTAKMTMYYSIEL